MKTHTDTIFSLLKKKNGIISIVQVLYRVTIDLEKYLTIKQVTSKKKVNQYFITKQNSINSHHSYILRTMHCQPL